jgi:hypothetical protein
LGRAVIRLREAGGGATFREAVLRACLRDDRYDRQCEEGRERFRFDVMAATGEPEFYRRWLLRATTPGRLRGNDGEQLVALLRVFAEGGDAEARARLYTIFAVNAVTERPDGATDIVELDGLAALLFVMPRLVIDADDPCFARYLIGIAIERDGEAAAWAALAAVADADLVVARLLALVQADEQRERAGQGRDAADTGVASDYPAIRARLRAGERAARRHLWCWARGATAAELVPVAHDLLAEDDLQRRNAYLWIFQHRPFPLDHTPLLALAREPSRRTAAPVISVLAKIEHNKVRALALELLAAGRGDGARLLAANYQAGDYALVERLLLTWTDREELHDLGFGLHDMVESHPQLDAHDALRALYEQGPCSMCRRHTIALLAELGPLPAWLVEEYRWDADHEVRALSNDDRAEVNVDAGSTPSS